MKREALLVFARNPYRSKGKRRLLPFLGEEGVRELQREILSFLLSRISPLKGKVIGFVEGGTAREMEEIFPSIFWLPQGEGDLGEKMAQGFSHAFSQGAKRVIIVGGDCPGFTAFHAKEGFQALKQYDAILFPALDGGYVALGLSRPAPFLFSSMPWGTERVFQETVMRLQSKGWSYHVFPPLPDIDEKEDLPRWEALKEQKISCIIPTLNEEKTLLSTLQRVKGKKGVEVLVVDGGSQDQTAALAKKVGVKVLSAPPGRAYQMNYGAQHATGSILLFLHGDTLLPKGWEEAVRHAFQDPCVSLTAFRWEGDHPALFYRFLGFTVLWRNILWGTPYGDQGLATLTSLFSLVGGFPEVPVLEDLLLVKRLKTLGKFQLLKGKAYTSVRRYEEKGRLSTLFLHKKILLAHFLGREIQRRR